MSGNALLIGLVVAIFVVVLVFILLGAYLTAHRLDRLHIRTDLARASLLGNLERRRTVAAAVARELGLEKNQRGRALHEAVSAARRFPLDSLLSPQPRQVDPAAERAENSLGLQLARISGEPLPAELHAEVTDIVDRVSMARRFYNDAVRDTRVLREHGLVRFLRLAGHAPMPDYVELVDPPELGN